MTAPSDENLFFSKIILQGTTSVVYHKVIETKNKIVRVSLMKSFLTQIVWIKKLLDFFFITNPFEFHECSYKYN